jgi:hypothetical protein
MCGAPAAAFYMLTRMRVGLANGASVVTPLQIQVIATYLRSYALVGSLEGTVIINAPALQRMDGSGGFPEYVYPVVIAFPTAIKTRRVDADGAPCVNSTADGANTVVLWLDAWVERCGVAAAALTRTLQQEDVQAAMIALANDVRPTGSSLMTSLTFSDVTCFKKPTCDA